MARTTWSPTDTRVKLTQKVTSTTFSFQAKFVVTVIVAPLIFNTMSSINHSSTQHRMETIEQT